MQKPAQIRSAAKLGRVPIIELRPVALSEAELLARLYRALGDESRIRILELLLQNGDLHQGEIVKKLKLSQSRASEHLKCLTWCGFVTSYPGKGKRTYYKVEKKLVETIFTNTKAFLTLNRSGISSCRVINGEKKEHQ